MRKQLRRREQSRQQEAQLVHRPQRQRMRDVVGKSHLRINRPHGIGERTTSGDDQHWSAARHRDRLLARVA